MDNTIGSIDTLCYIIENRSRQCRQHYENPSHFDSHQVLNRCTVAEDRKTIVLGADLHNVANGAGFLSATHTMGFNCRIDEQIRWNTMTRLSSSPAEIEHIFCEFSAAKLCLQQFGWPGSLDSSNRYEHTFKGTTMSYLTRLPSSSSSCSVALVAVNCEDEGRCGVNWSDGHFSIITTLKPTRVPIACIFLLTRTSKLKDITCLWVKTLKIEVGQLEGNHENCSSISEISE